MKRLRPIMLIVAAVAIVLIAQHFLKRSAPAGRSGMSGETTVVVETVSEREFIDRTEAIGTVSANESIVITPAVSERVANILFEDGAEVEAGAVLVELEHAEESAALEEARVNLSEQTRRFERVQALSGQGMVAQEELDAAQTELEAARARYLAAEARLRDRIITAPFAGVLGIRRVSPGALVSPGEVITTLDELSVVKVDFTVPEISLAGLSVGQSVEARSASWPGDIFRGSVTGIDSRVDPTTRAVGVQARVPNPRRRLRAGMLLTVELTSNTRRAPGVPERALLSYADRQYVFVVGSEQTVQQREIVLGARDVGWVEVVGGLSPGDTIVVDGIMNLRDGSRVSFDGAGDSVPPQTETPRSQDE